MSRAHKGLQSKIELIMNVLIHTVQDVEYYYY